jgi:hypothetical protein
VVYKGGVGFAGSTSSALTQTVNKAGTSTSVASSNNPSRSGQKVTFKAIVSPSTATGTVQFFDGPNLLGAANLSGGAASLSTSALSVGSHSITASYGGDSNYNSNNSTPLTQTVIGPQGKTSTTFTVTSSSNPASFGQQVTLTAKVSGGYGTATGLVQFFDGNAWLGAVTLSGGSGSFATSTLALGSHSIGVSYSGDSNYNPNASQPYSQVIVAQPPTQPASSTTTVTASANPAYVGQLVTLTATVTAAGGTPTGIVQFFDGSRWIGAVTLSNGSGSIVTSSLAPGTHTIGGAYGGDSNFNTNASAPYYLIVN